MMQPAIRVENLSKQYRIGRRPGPATRNLTESITEGAKSLGRWLTGRGESNGDDTFWALKDASFEVQPGEVVGIVGRNGAGKSTLLKILSRIVEPTSGRAEYRGRIGSLLEVGTGFHSELTGRENIYLNGSLLGLSQREIERKFDEIVAFSEIEQFLDTPVKRYSSGMYVRLAFAVAAHLEPDILIIDEVLAVGDATYQRRCVERMAEFARSGRTVLFVSHNMDVIPRLCRRAVLLEGGEVAAVGAAGEIVQAYLQSSSVDTAGADLNGRHRTGDGRARFLRWWLERPDGSSIPAHPSGEDLLLCMEIEATQAVPDVALAVVLRTITGTRLITSWTREVGERFDLENGRQIYRCHFRRVAVRPGHRLSVMLWMEATGVIDSVEDAGVFQVVDGPRSSHYSTDVAQGVVLCDYTWQQGR
jgi:lipopolysaccharide transport system ATP-binding protein